MSSNDTDRIPVHPVADLFPMLPEDELSDLADDIKANGLQQPIVIQDGTLIDGRNRLAACKLAKIEPTFAEVNGVDPVAYILSANLARRHMTKGQKGMTAAFVILNIAGEEGRSLASIHGISEQYVSRAKVVAEADSALADQVLAGVIPLNDAYKKIQDRKKEARRLAEQREQLRSIAPDLDDQVSEEVLQLTEALDQARERDRIEKERQRDAVDLLERILGLVAPDHVDDEFIESWAGRIGSVKPEVKEKTQQAGEALVALAERMST